jgi:hypothetical protein
MQKILHQIRKEPLLHFLILGGVLFALDSWRAGPEVSVDPRQISVDDTALVNYMQYRARKFDPADTRQMFTALTPAEHQDLLQDYVAEEALYREAARMELDKYDYVARLRLIQQLEFVLGGAVGVSEDSVSDETIAAYYAEHRHNYTRPASISFTHVFVDARVHGDAAARQQAEHLLAELSRQRVPFQDAPRYGDRAPFLLNYVDKAPGEIASHFGQTFARHIFADTLPLQQWQGPLQSSYGYHLVLAVKRTPETLPALADITDRVRVDIREQQVAARLKALKAAIISQYRVQDLTSAPTAAVSAR